MVEMTIWPSQVHVTMGTAKEQDGQTLWTMEIVTKHLSGFLNIRIFLFNVIRRVLGLRRSHLTSTTVLYSLCSQNSFCCYILCIKFGLKMSKTIMI